MFSRLSSSDRPDCYHGTQRTDCQLIFDKNPNHEFYVVESLPVVWMYTYLEPHGLIMKINRTPLASLPDEDVRSDREYWTKYISPMVGDWLNKDTPVSAVAAFAEKVYVEKDFSGFTGDARFVKNDYSQQMFSKLRESIASLYVWRGQHASDALEKQRMNDEADFAFRQAWALCPYSQGAVYGYVNYLQAEKRGADALLVVETASKMPDADKVFQKLVKEVSGN